MYTSVEPVMNDGMGFRVTESEVLIDPKVDPEAFLDTFMRSKGGSLMAGAPSPFYSGIEKTANDALFRYGMDQTPRGAEIRRRIEEIRKRPLSEGGLAGFRGV